ncbi:MAG: outer membrane beta-barrel protein [Pirellulales bacterium]|nr:outer membrane beta-barrel protein [Pirellulales bacterium]
MTSEKRIPTAWLLAAVCLAWAAVSVRAADGREESSVIFAGPTPSVTPHQNYGGWTASTGRWTPIRRAAFEQPAEIPVTPPEPPPTFPQIKNPLQSPRLVDAGPEANPALPGNVQAAESCPECGSPMDDPSVGFCRRCLRGGSRLFRLLSPKRWLQIDPELRAQREPWLYRPFSAGLFMGSIVGSTLIDDSIQQGTGFLAGARFGYDFDDDWGLEMRLASASIPLYGGYPNNGAQHSADHFLWDIDFLYYPWGDAALRPYVLMGIGTARIKFSDQQGDNLSRILAGMPVGIGLKWRLGDWFIFRLECLDNVAFAGGSVFQTQHNPSLTGGLEIRFGRPRVQYWPWNPGMRQ